MTKEKLQFDPKTLLALLSTTQTGTVELDQAIASYFGYKHLKGKTWRTPRGLPRAKTGVPAFSQSINSTLALYPVFLPEYQVEIHADYSKPESLPWVHVNHWTIPRGSNFTRPVVSGAGNRLGVYDVASPTIEIALLVALVKAHQNHPKFIEKGNEAI